MFEIPVRHLKFHKRGKKLWSILTTRLLIRAVFRDENLTKAKLRFANTSEINYQRKIQKYSRIQTRSWPVVTAFHSTPPSYSTENIDRKCLNSWISAGLSQSNWPLKKTFLKNESENILDFPLQVKLFAIHSLPATSQTLWLAVEQISVKWSQSDN